MEHDQPKVKANKLLKWLDDNGAEIHRQPGSERLPGPFEWIPETSEFQGWLSNGPPTLLLVGRPGSGKTTAASLVVDTLLRQDHLGRRVGVAFLHVGTGKKKRNAMQLLRSLLYQLGQRLASSYIRSRNHPPMEDILDILSETTPNPSQGDMVSRVLPKVIDKFDRVYVVVDELDQMTENRRRLYSSLLGLRNENLRLFLTTCHSPDEKSRLHKDPQILISGANVGKDLDTYITKRLTDLPKFIGYRPIVEGRVKKRVMEDANELILAAKLLMDGLMNMRGANIEPKLESTGDLLKELFERFITRVQGFDDTKQNFAKEILAWLLLMKRPMREAEMRYILKRDSDGSILGSDKAVNYERFVGLCKDFNILIYDKNSNRFAILRPASQYLLSTLDDWCPGAKTMVARRCLEFLALDEFSKGPCKTDAEYESRLQNYKLYKYAARHWVDHLQDLQNVPTILIRSFFMDNNKVASANQVMSVSDQRPPQSGYSQRFDPPGSGLHLAAQVGSTSVLARLLEEKPSTAQEDTKGRTPLWCAIEYDRQEAMKLLSLVDRTTFTRLLQRKQISLASALIRAAGSSIRDTVSNTALHIGVIKRDMNIVRLSLECGIAIDEKGMNGHTAIELAMGLGYSDVIVLLLNHSPDTSRITAQDWLQAFGKRTESSKPFIIQLEEDVLRRKEIDFHIVERFQMKEFPMQYLKRRLLTFPNSSGWPDYDGGIWKVNSLIYAFPILPAYGISPIHDTQRCSIFAGVPSQAPSGTVNLFRYKLKELMISWNVEIRPDLDGNNRWVSIDHWSTLRKGSIPDSGMAFLDDLIKELIMGWLEFCDQIDIYLLKFRLRVLDANGKSRSVIDELLEDATTWIHLRRGHRGQVDTLRNFFKGYQNKVYEDEGSKLVASTIQEFSSTIQSRFDKFDEDSSALIQLEFNLTSIRESQKSNSLSISMKRLSWITFVFLPLTFVSGLFGMNVNILADNPPWWWCLIFMSGTLSLTMLVWLTCRKYPALEDKVDAKLSWLKPNHAGKKIRDVELDLLSQERKDR